MKKLPLYTIALLWTGLSAGGFTAEPADAPPATNEPPPASAPPNPPPPNAEPSPDAPSPVRSELEITEGHVNAFLAAKAARDMSAALDVLVRDGAFGATAVVDRLRREMVRPTPNREVVSRLNHALVKIGKPSLLSVVAAFRSPTEPEALRAEMARILGRLQGYRSVYALVEVLAEVMDQNPSPLAARILEVLGDLSDPRPFPSMERALIHPDPSVRFAAATAMGKLSDPSAVPLLIRALDDPDLAVRAAANRALVRLSGVDQGYAADLPDAPRAAAIEKWRGWWMKNRDRMKPPLDPLQAEIWKHADEVLAWAVGGKPLPGLKGEVAFPGAKAPAADPVVVSTADLPNGTVPVLEGRRIVLRSPESLQPVPLKGYWRFGAPNVAENRAEWTLTHLVPGQKVQAAVLKYALTPEGWKLEDVTLSEGQETPLPPPTEAKPAGAKPMPPAPAKG